MSTRIDELEATRSEFDESFVRGVETEFDVNALYSPFADPPGDPWTSPTENYLMLSPKRSDRRTSG